MNFGAAYALMFGTFGLPALGLVGAGIGTVISSTFMFVGLALVIVLDPAASGATTCSGASGAPTGRAIARSGGSACRSA